MRVAIVGTGIAGLGAASTLQERADLTVFEAGGHVGGHANTVDVDTPAGRVPVDTGFIVYNERNYPLLARLFREYDVPTEPSDMSFSASLDDGAFEYRGSAGGLLARRSNLADPAAWRIAADMPRFARAAGRLLGEPSDVAFGQFLRESELSDAFVERYLVPMTACIWSATREDILAQPARTLLRFLDNHGLVALRDRPRWRTVSGGSREYVRRVSAPFRSRIRLRTPVTGVRRIAGGVEVRDARGGPGVFDAVVLATHADDTLGLLRADPAATAGERRVLGTFPYRPNRAVLHTDQTMLENWNEALAVLRPAIRHPDVAQPTDVYGEAFDKARDLAPIPERDLPAELPDWMRSLMSWAVRDAIHSGNPTDEKRATLVVRVPTDDRHWLQP